ncbi:MAG: hypothetical protein QXW42_01685 [Thermofilum sp.]
MKKVLIYSVTFIKINSYIYCIMAVQWSVKAVKDYVDKCSETLSREECAKRAEETVGTWTYRVNYSFFISGVFTRVLQRFMPDVAWKIHDTLVTRPRQRIAFDEQLYLNLLRVFSEIEKSPASPEDRIHAKKLRELIETALRLRSSIERV